MPRTFAIFAHPDDIEFVAAGTLLLLREAGHEIHYMNLSDGCCGSTVHGRDELARLRADEARAACAVAGADVSSADRARFGSFYDRPTLARLAAVVREVAPEIVLTHSPVDYMEDHTNACRLAVTAAFARGMPNFPTDPPRPAGRCARDASIMPSRTAIAIRWGGPSCRRISSMSPR